jgi:hypothetical protein
VGELKSDWYRSKKGWASAMLAAAYFVLDHVSRAETAKDIYRFLVGPPRAFLVVVSPYVPLVLFAIAILFFEMERRKRAQPKENKKLVIHSAMYGIGAFNDVSVLDKLNSAVKDALVISVDNNLVDGHDPAPNQPKRLRVEYSYGNSAKRVVERPESQPGHGSVLVLPEDSEIQ